MFRTGHLLGAAKRSYQPLPARQEQRVESLEKVEARDGRFLVDATSKIPGIPAVVDKPSSVCDKAVPDMRAMSDVAPSSACGEQVSECSSVEHTTKGSHDADCVIVGEDDGALNLKAAGFVNVGPAVSGSPAKLLIKRLGLDRPRAPCPPKCPPPKRLIAAHTHSFGNWELT